VENHIFNSFLKDLPKLSTQKTSKSRISALWVFIAIISTPSLSFSQNVEFDHITYLTGNLDSLVRSFLQQGFTVTPSTNLANDVEAYRIWLPDTTYVELQSTNARDSSDWRVSAIKAYGTHISSLALRTDHLDSIYALFDTSSVGKIYQWTNGRGFGFRSPGPMELTILQRNSAYLAKISNLWKRVETTVMKDSIIHSLPYHHPNGAYKIHWLLLTASPNQEQFLRGIYEKLGFPRRNETYWDYWLIGPADHRQVTRFEIFPDTLTGEWLSIENGGVIYAIDP